MRIRPLRTVTFRILLDAGTVVGLNDGLLLDLFESRRDETAFTAQIGTEQQISAGFEHLQSASHTGLDPGVSLRSADLKPF